MVLGLHSSNASCQELQADALMHCVLHAIRPIICPMRWLVDADPYIPMRRRFLCCMHGKGSLYCKLLRLKGLTCDKVSYNASVLPRGVVSHSCALVLVAWESAGSGMTAVMGCPDTLSTACTAHSDSKAQVSDNGAFSTCIMLHPLWFCRHITAPKHPLSFCLTV